MDKNQNLKIIEKPRLRHPYIICGISGWVNGGESATGSVQYLRGKLEAKLFAEIPIERFHVFQVPGETSSRPHIKLEDGLLKEHRFPSNQFFYWLNPNADNDLILFLGMEPNLNWEGYGNAILDLAEGFAAARIYLLGGVMDKTPHTKEPHVSCACSSDEIKEEMQRYSVQFSSYQGPGSFGTTMLHMGQSRQTQMVSMSTRATYYPEFNIIIPRNPKAIRAIVKRLNSLLHLYLDLSDLDGEVDEFESKIGFMTSHNPQFKAYVEELERDFTEIKYEEPLNISPDEAVRIAEEFLKRDRET